MEDNLADDEIEIELAPLAVQLAYVQQLLGNTPEAMEAYTGIINRNLADESSLAVAVNNLVALKGPKDISDSLRKLDRLMEKGNGAQSFQLSNGLESKLSPKQRETIYTNRVLLLLHANRMDQARELVAALPDMFADSVMPVLLQAAVLVRENKSGKAEEILGQFAEKFPNKAKVVLLARAQIAAVAGHPQIAAESLSKIADIQHLPATVATIVSLKERAGDIDGAEAVFDSAIQWWSNAMTEDNKLTVIMQEAASFKLKHGREKEAARLYEELVKSHGSVQALIGLVTTAARVDVDKAEAYEKQLKPLPGLKGVDVESLERTSGAKHIQSDSRVGITEAYEESKNKEKAKKKRKRKPRYPKGFDPANPGPPPDPERWLPKRERSSYRPKRKDKRAAQVRGSQGAVVREKHEAAGSDTSANTSNSKSDQATTSKGSSQNAVASQSKPSSKSSKKKSRK
ncbi:Signal recognition particle subunit SRP72 [Vitis vinifera]|uniref:Signal recognition particle subunit SRP72 n=1 Tax=Vitis vinifera TaxID=29760 RepID=A0A438DIQ8_VITVI|nr:Signal recognition particle subunit SRP72 [Vitis vinifera]